MDAANIGLAVLHVATGVFFTVTGARKLAVPEVRQKVMGLFDSLHVPKPVQYAVMAGEFFGGLGLLFGCLTQAAAAGLLIIMFGAYKMDTWPSVLKKQGDTWSWSKLVSNALCNPEAQLIVILISILFMGAGAFSLDALIF
jgi:putative oxidoreductase